MPKVKNPMRSAAEKTRAINHVGFALDQRLEQGRVVVRVVLEVSILDEYKVSRGLLYAPSQGRSLSHVLRLQQHPEIGVLTLQLRQNFPGAVAGTIVHANQFHL